MYFVNDLPYLKAVRKKAFLPKGQPISQGNLIFLFSPSIEKSFEMINDETTVPNGGKYFWYFYNLLYRGTIYGKRYLYRDMKERLAIYKRVPKETNIRSYATKPIISGTEKRNTYYELARYYEIFNQYSSKLNAVKLVDCFWKYFTPIFKDQYGYLDHKYVLINANNFKDFKGDKLRDQLNNPLFLIYYTLWKQFDLIAELDIDFIIYANGKIMRFNPSKCDEKSYRIYLRELKKIYSVATVPIETIAEEEINTEEEEKEEEPRVKFKSEKMSVTKKTALPIVDKITAVATKLSASSKKKIEQKVIHKVSSVSSTMNIDKIKDDEKKKEVVKEIQKKVEDEINTDEDVIKEVYNTMQKEFVPKSTSRSTARDNLLREEQKKLNIKGSTLKSIEKQKDVDIETTDITQNVKSTNENTKIIKFNNFNKTYNDKLLNKDIMDCFTQLNNKSIKMFIRNVDIEDTSDELNYKETWTVKLEDENRNRHTIKVDIPKFLEYKFLWLGGNRKNIKNQMFFLPFVKIDKDRVLIVSNYNKFTIQRVDTKSLRGLSRIETFIQKSDSFKDYFISGNTFFENKDFITAIEYDEFGKSFRKFHKSQTTIYFSQVEAKHEMEKKMIKIKSNEMFIGFEKGEPLILNIKTQKDKKNRGIVDIILDTMDETQLKEYKSIKTPKRLMHTQITTMKQDCPLIIMLCIWEGLSTVLKKAKIKYRLGASIRDIKVNEDYIRFKNCYLIYEDDIESELLINGLKLLDTASHDIGEYETQEVYLPYVERKYGRINAINTLNNAYEFMLGSIEISLLKDMNLPTDIVSLCIHANEVLCDNQYDNELVQTHSRIRCNEIIPAILYDKIAKAYTPFKNSNGKKKLSIPQDCVIKEILKQKTVEDYDSLNPLLELETNHGVSTKGFRGINLEQSYSVPKRCYDDSMIGVIGPSSSPDGNVGVNRSLTMEPNIKTARGYIEVKKDNLNEVKDVNLFSPAELLIPLGVTRDDPVRTGHSVKQSRHTIPVVKSSPVLISNGSDEMCKYYLSSDFVVNAKMDGKVVENDPSTKIMVVEYKDGTHQAIDLGKKLAKNGGGGFELSNQLITNLTVGSRFKKNDTLAWHKNFFKNDKYQGTRLCVGTLAKVAITSSYNTYEDGTFVTHGFSEKATTEMCFKKPVVIGRHSNVSQMVSVGQSINTGDPLIQFDDSFEEANINVLLNSLGDNEELKDAVISNNRNIVKSKYSGVIEEIKMYSTADLEDLSPSLQKIFKRYYDKINNRKKVLKKYNEKDGIVYCGMMINEPTGKVEPNRYGTIRGEKVNDGVLIEFYIKHQEPLEVGSKIA